jgi:CBS domain-containing protein
MEIHNWITHTTAADLMCRDVVSVWPNHTLAQAAAVMLREQVSGLPVVDTSGVCVGVFSVTDVLRAEEKVTEEQQRIAMSGFFNSGLALPASVYTQKLEQIRDKIAPASEQPVERFMTADLVSVTEDASLTSIVQSMVDAHLHRVLVADADRRLKGIVATTDVLAALLRVSQQVVESGEAKHLREQHHL